MKILNSASEPKVWPAARAAGQAVKKAESSTFAVANAGAKLKLSPFRFNAPPVVLVMVASKVRIVPPPPMRGVLSMVIEIGSARTAVEPIRIKKAM